MVTQTASPETTRAALNRLRGVAMRQLETHPSEEVAAAQRRHIERNKMLFCYPTRGEESDLFPFCREDYPRHMDFYRAGKEHCERSFVAANRCITPWTPIQTDRGERQCAEILGEEAFSVRSWDGSSRCTKRASGVFLKSTEPAFRIQVSTGEYFDCTLNHRILTISGWMTLANLLRASCGLRYLQTEKGWKASYANGVCLDDEPLPRETRNVPEPPPSLADVQVSNRGGLLADARGREPLHTHDCRKVGWSQILDEHTLIEMLCGRFGDPAPSYENKWPRALRQELRRRVSGYIPQTIIPEAGRHLFSLGDCFDGPGLRPAATPYRESLPEPPKRDLSASWYGPGSPKRWLLSSHERTETFVPYLHPPLRDNVFILSVTSIGVQPILDFSVEETHCYEASGVIHHNTGKNYAASFEIAFHMTGIYPSWWEGFRFAKPTKWWIAHRTWDDVRDVSQAQLLGQPEDEDALGTGSIPANLLHSIVRNAHIKNGITSFQVRHISGGSSFGQFKTYEQGFEAFESHRVNGIWLDELCPLDIYSACKARTVNTEGGKQNDMIILTFTPVEGLSDLLLRLTEQAVNREALPW